MPRPQFACSVRRVAAAASLAVVTTAQCNNPWLPVGGLGIHGVDQPVRCSAMWDPDGPGPLVERLLLGGDFTAAGNLGVNGFVMFNPATGVWSTLPNAAFVDAIATTGSGDLVLSGRFGANGNQIARWNGASWTMLGAVAGGVVRTLALLPNGDLLAGGTFTSLAGIAAANLARWNGTSWSQIGGANGGVYALHIRPNSDLVIGGEFNAVGGTLANNIAVWNGTTWAGFGNGVQGPVLALATMPNGDLAVGGSIWSAGGAPIVGLARWNGATWSSFGNPLGVYSLATLPNGDLLVAGDFQLIGGVPCNAIARFDGTTWSSFGSGISVAYTVAASATGEIFVGGGFGQAGGVSALNTARWDGVAWSTLSPLWTDGRIDSAAVLANGDVVAGGAFTRYYGIAINNLARWNGTTWTPFGDPNGRVNDMRVLANGTFVVAGSFSTIGGVPASTIAQWSGAGWSSLGSGVTGAARLLVLPNGELLVGGNFTTAGGVPANNIARWNGSAWSALGTGVNDSVGALTVLPNGDIVAGGQFTMAGGVPANYVARWNGATWSAMTGFPSGVRALACTPTGDVIAAEGFAVGSVSVGRVYRWAGAAWQPLGGTFSSNGLELAIASLAVTPDGDILAGGSLNTGGIRHGLMRWDGTAWSVVVGGPRSGVSSLQPTSNGDWLVPGFSVPSGSPASYLARLTTTCPAAANPVGAGCSGSAAPNALAPMSLPWIGAVFTSRADGLAMPSLGIQVLGLAAASTLLAAISPQGLPGCSLLVSPDLLIPAVPSAGSAGLSLAIPDALTLVGQSLRQQLVALELDAFGAVSGLSSTNALMLTIGAF